jgi:uncharacterized damage-inducible protein DinB
LALCTLFTFSVAQAAFDWKANFLKHWGTSHAFTIAVAEAMPADGYDYVPPSTVEPKERTFAGLLIHIGQAEANYVGRVTGEKGPAAPAAGTTDKAAVIKYLNDVNAYATKALEGASDETLDKMVGPEGRQVPGRDALLGAFTHTAHTRGQCEVYLRLKNVKPPDYKF